MDAEYVEILSPKSLRDTVLKTLQDATQKYSSQNEKEQIERCSVL